VYERSHAKSEARPEGAGNDRSICAFFAVRTCAGCDGANGRTRAGPDEHTHAEWMVTQGNLANGVPRETLLAGVGVERDLICREARQATRSPEPRLFLDPELIAEIDPKCKILEQTGVNTAGGA